LTPGDIFVAVTARDVNSPLATFMPTAKPSGFGMAAVALPGQGCPGDCNGNGQVTVDELLIGVNIALGNMSMNDCGSFDGSGDGEVTVDELLAAVNMALDGCAGY